MTNEPASAAWQDIESAPDRRPVLVFDPYYLVRVARKELASVAMLYGFDVSADAEWVWVTDLPYGFERGERGGLLEPTHWAPIPLPLPSVK